MPSWEVEWALLRLDFKIALGNQWFLEKVSQPKWKVGKF